MIAERRRSPLASGVKRDGVLPALARVRAPAEPVHRDRECLVRLARDRAEAHRTGAEALDDLARRLDLLERDRALLALAAADLQQAAQRRAAGGILVDELCVLAVLRERRAVAHRRVRGAVALQRRADVAVGRAHGVLDERDRLGVPHVVLAVAPPGVDAADGQQLVLRRRVGARVALERLAREHVRADPADTRRGPREMRVDQVPIEADRLEDLRAAIGLDRRDAHLRDRLQQPFADRLDEVLRGPLEALVDLLAGRPGAGRLLRVIREMRPSTTISSSVSSSR